MRGPSGFFWSTHMWRCGRCRDSEEYKRWKAFQEAEASGDAAGAEAALTELKLRDKDGNEIEKQLPGGKARGHRLGTSLYVEGRSLASVFAVSWRRAHSSGHLPVHITSLYLWRHHQHAT